MNPQVGKQHLSVSLGDNQSGREQGTDRACQPQSFMSKSVLNRMEGVLGKWELEDRISTEHC